MIHLTQMNKGPYFFYYKNDIYHLIFQSFVAYIIRRVRRGRDRMVVRFT